MSETWHCSKWILFVKGMPCERVGISGHQATPDGKNVTLWFSKSIYNFILRLNDLFEVLFECVLSVLGTYFNFSIFMAIE